MSEDFSAYVSARWPALVRSAVLLGCSYEEAEDVVQTALIRCYRSWDRVTRASDTDAYVYRVMVNCWAKSRKRRWWGEEPTADLPEPVGPDSTEDVALSDSVATALGRLPQRHRAVLVLRYVADMTEQQVAEILGIPVGTVKSRLSRAIAACAADVQLIDLQEGRE